MIEALESELARLKTMSRGQLRDRWRDLHRVAPPIAFTPDLLARGIAWLLQEKALGGHSAEVRRLLKASGDRTSRSALLAKNSLRAGNRLVRRWRGRTYIVDVTDSGLMYAGKRYTSLSVIAREITGTRWSGPKFFGLVK